jgi:hypothetical protein
MAAHLANQITVDWISTNISAVRCYLVSIDGTRVSLATATGTYDRPSARDGHYAGSHAQDFGCGIVSDTGTDDLATGISATTLADSERAFAYELLGGFLAAAIEFEIDVVSTASTVALHYPEFHIPSTAWRMICENGHYQDLIYPGGAL